MLGASAFGLLCANAALLSDDTLARALQGRRLVFTEAGEMALAAAKQVLIRLFDCQFKQILWLYIFKHTFDLMIFISYFTAN